VGGGHSWRWSVGSRAVFDDPRPAPPRDMTARGSLASRRGHAGVQADVVVERRPRTRRKEMRGKQKMGTSTLPRRRRSRTSTFGMRSATWPLTRRDPTRDSTPASEHRSSMPTSTPPTKRASQPEPLHHPWGHAARPGTSICDSQTPAHLKAPPFRLHTAHSRNRHSPPSTGHPPSVPPRISTCASSAASLGGVGGLRCLDCLGAYLGHPPRPPSPVLAGLFPLIASLKG